MIFKNFSSDICTYENRVAYLYQSERYTRKWPSPNAAFYTLNYLTLRD